ncbi:MAG TPA: hypothetical protein VL131_05070 [Gammaproteobacteria bacterium]|nr:hypothetical protein [Gammaproteobacteria bacterium]
MDRGRGRATAISIALHAIVAAGALLIRAHLVEGPGRPSIIEGALLLDASNTSSPSAPGPSDELSAQQPEEAADTLAASAEPAADAQTAETPSPTVVEQAAHELAAATVEAAATAESAAGSDQTTAIAELATTESPTAESSLETTAARSASETAPRAGQHSEPVPAREHAMLSRRFESWTGELPQSEAGSRVAWKQKGQEYSAVFHTLQDGDPTGIERVVVDVSTQQGGKKMSTQLTLTRLSFSNFAQFVDRWDPDVQIHDDEIDGRFHSNSVIKVLSTGSVSPVFHGKVTLASNDIDTASSLGFNRRRIFPDGVEMGVRRIVLPSRFFGFLNAAADGDRNVQRFERDARITFHEDGTYSWSYIRDGGAEERREVTSPAYYLLGLAGATLRIKGTVRGKVLVYSADRIVIDNDVRYAHAHDAPDADDYLGLVAENAVEIAEPEVTGLGDLKVDASIYARREFAVRDFRSRTSGTLRIFGSLTAGSLTATEPRFATKIEFDPRLKNARPPSFPLTDRYELESWNGEWRVEDQGDGTDPAPTVANEGHDEAEDDSRTAATAAP